jgi:hypothetical protein
VPHSYPRTRVRARARRAAPPLLLFVALSLAPLAHVDAQSGGTFSLTQVLIANGGGTSSGGTRTVAGTISLVCAGPTPGGQMTGGTIRLRGGFWPEDDGVEGDVLHADGFEESP